MRTDVTARFDTIRLDEEAPDRVRISGVRGEPPPRDLKVAVNRFGGFRNQLTLVLTGPHVEEKAALVRRTLAPALAGLDVDERLVPVGETDAHLLVAVEGRDPERGGRGVSAA